MIQAQSSARLSRSTHGGLGGGGGGGRYGSRSRLDGGSMGGGGGSRHGSQVDLSRSVQMTGEEDYIQPYEPQPQRAPRVNSQTYRSYERNLLFKCSTFLALERGLESFSIVSISHIPFAIPYRLNIQDQEPIPPESILSCTVTV